jgi:hypothetical protein
MARLRFTFDVCLPDGVRVLPFWRYDDQYRPLRVEAAVVLATVKDASRREDAVAYGHP